MKKRLAVFAAAMVVAGSMAFGAVTSDALISQYQAAGYTRIEIKRGPTQIKVEAIKGTEKLEVIYDIATGTILKRELATLDNAPIRTGVQVQDRDRDFIRSGDDDDDDDGHGGDDDDDGHDDDDDGHDDDDGDGDDDDDDDDGDDSDDDGDDSDDDGDDGDDDDGDDD